MVQEDTYFKIGLTTETGPIGSKLAVGDGAADGWGSIGLVWTKKTVFESETDENGG